MDHEEFLIRTIDGDEIPRAPCYVNNVMGGLVKTLDEKYGDELEDDDIVVRDGFDLTYPRWLGVDLVKGGPGPNFGTNHKVFPNPSRKFSNLPWAQPEILLHEFGSDLHVSDLGIMNRVMVLNKEGSHHFYVEGLLSTPERYREWKDEGHFDRWSPPSEESLKRFEAFKNYAVIKDIYPLASCVGPFSNGWAMTGIVAFFKGILKKKWHGWIHEVLNEYTGNLLSWIDAIGQSTSTRIIMVCDDLGWKKHTYMKNEHFTRFISPYMRKITKRAHKYDIRVILHSDGFVEPLIPTIIDDGFDGLQTLEQEAGNDLNRVKENHGDKICLLGNISILHTLTYGPIEKVIADTRECLEIGMPGGRFFPGPSASVDNMMPVEFVKACFDTIRKYGRYN
ncbi:MAG: uroporphyrinogen decarboxylase family protein [Promethearchaeota archaeon]